MVGHRGSEDAALVRAIADEGDREAFAELFRRYAPRLHVFLRRSALSPGQVDDLVQDVMLELWRRADRYDPDRAAVSTWLFTIARNRFIDQVRKQRRPEPEGYGEDPVPTPEQLAERQQEARRVARAVEALPAEQARAVSEVFFRHRTHEQAAAATGVPAGTQKSRLRAALASLRKTLGRQRR